MKNVKIFLFICLFWTGACGKNQTTTSYDNGAASAVNCDLIRNELLHVKTASHYRLMAMVKTVSNAQCLDQTLSINCSKELCEITNK